MRELVCNELPPVHRSRLKLSRSKEDIAADSESTRACFACEIGCCGALMDPHGTKVASETPLHESTELSSQRFTAGSLQTT